LIGALLALAASWGITDERMRGMDAGPGTDLGKLGFWVDMILSGDATASTWIKCPLNSIVPFIVSNLALLS
jgi:hypothetical protein